MLIQPNDQVGRNADVQRAAKWMLKQVQHDGLGDTNA